MSAGIRQFDRGSIARPDRTRLPLPARAAKATASDLERLRIVRDDEPVLPRDGSWGNAGDIFHEPRHPFAAQLAEQLSPRPVKIEDENTLETIEPREPGVDLSMVRPHDLDTAKLAAFLNDPAASRKDGKRGSSNSEPNKPVAMPLAKTDLQKMLESDSVCMVATAKASDSPAGSHSTTDSVLATDKNVCPPDRVAEVDLNASPAASIAIPPKKAARELDATALYLVENWPQLPPNVQAAILNVIEVAISPDD
jgi:hypothetical protein